MKLTRSGSSPICSKRRGGAGTRRWSSASGLRSIHHMGHVKMMAAAQPFISGAISKTVNVPENVTTGEIEETYLQAWRLGLKAIAIYRDNSKRTQPLSTGKTVKLEAA